MKIGVRRLVEFCCISGDLGGMNHSGINAIQGQQIHQLIQHKYADKAQAEVSIKAQLEVDGTEVELGGRIDLLFEQETPPRIEEIKTVVSTSRADDHSVHWAQLKCYGALYAEQQQLDAVCLSLNQVNLFTEKEKRQRETLERDELTSFLHDLIQRYLTWHLQVQAMQAETRRTAELLEFPHDNFRKQQRFFAAEVYRSIRDGGQLMVEAPTGSGKTISTLFPAIKAMGDDYCEQIVYLSAKVSGQQQALGALRRMIARGLSLSYAVIQAKSRSCPCFSGEECINDDGQCTRCLGFFDRLPEAREQLLQLRQLDVEQIQATAEAFQLCPFELTLQMIPWVDVVICDFNYVFDPLVQLGWFTDDSIRKVLLIDELHNLVDRARGMYSARLNQGQLKLSLQADNGRQVNRVLRSLQQELSEELQQLDSDEAVSETLPQQLLDASYQVSEKIAAQIFSDKRTPAVTLDMLKEIIRFQRIAQLYQQHHRSLAVNRRGEREIKLLCLNAFDYLRQCYPLFSSICGFSATLAPSQYFRDALGFSADSRQLQLQSPFPVDNLKVCIGSYADTRYQYREQSIDVICTTIAATYESQPGNYLVFFSSYVFLQQVLERFELQHPDIQTVQQQRSLNEQEHAEFLSLFFEHSNQVGFVILGGRFAEGIDYQGEALIGAIVVGVGLPQLSTEQKLIEADFAGLQLDGFDYAFRYPGLIRVMQSAGRVIRSETDRGVLVLLDRRFTQPGYRQPLPAFWQSEVCNSPESLEKSLQTFWQGKSDGN